MLKDLRYAVQLIVKERWYSAVAVLALALGIGLNATVFTLVNAVLIRGLPFKGSDHLYVLNSRYKQAGLNGVSFADAKDWRDQAHAFSGLASYDDTGANISDDRAAPQQARRTRVSSNMFGLLEQPLLLGRDFAPPDEKPGAEAVAILSYKLWQTRYGSDPKVLGRSFKIDSTPYTVVGVMPDGMQFPSNTDLWTPEVMTPDQQPRTFRFMNVVARLKDDVSRKAAQTEMDGIAARLAAAYPDTNKDYGTVLVQTFNERFNGDKIRAVFLSMLGAVGFVLLIACANVANLQLSRSVQRSREVAVRMALGATRWRIIRQLLVESVLLGCLGGVFGLLLAIWGVRMFDVAVSNVGKPYWIKFTMDYTVVGYLAALCVLTGILFGLAPALQVSRTNVNEILKENGRGNAGGRRARWMTATMVVLELALTVVLLVGAGLMVRSFLKIYTIDLGINTDHLLVMGISLPDSKYPAPKPGATTENRRVQFYDQLRARIAAVPGVEHTSLTTSVPPFSGGSRGVEIEGRPLSPGTARRTSSFVVVSPGFFDTVGVTLRHGRDFRESDGAPGSETVVVNERFVAEFFKGEDPIGHRVRLWLPNAAANDTTPPSPWQTIVGVSPTIRHAQQQDLTPTSVVYRPYRQLPPGGVSLLVRSHLDSGAVMNLVRREVQSIDPDQPVLQAQTLDEMLRQQSWPYRVFGSLFAIFAVIALVMSAVGLYAVMAYSVTQRTAEIGVRMALGAAGRDVSWLILKRGLLQLGLGLSIGLVGALFLSRALRSLLVDIQPRDPVTFASIAVILAIVSIVACLLPAHRATRVDPLIALRAE